MKCGRAEVYKCECVFVEETMNNEIKKIAAESGADACGIASAASFAGAPKGFHPADILSDAESVIVFGKQFPEGTFRAKSTAPYTMVRNQLINRLDAIALNLSYWIEKLGRIAVPIPSSEPYSYWDAARRHGRGILSLKHAAQLAGVGSIGKNTLLITREFGNRLWLGGIITNLKLEADAPAEPICPESCRICIDACPQSALDQTTIDQKKCREICFSSTEGGVWLIKCNMCRVECPFAL
jgi:epoxyqueuosine reductase